MSFLVMKKVTFIQGSSCGVSWEGPTQLAPCSGALDGSRSIFASLMEQMTFCLLAWLPHHSLGACQTQQKHIPEPGL